MIDQKQHKATRVFVLDDEQVIANTLASILKHEGYSAIAFFDPRQVVQACHENPPDILISDVVMPQMNGIELALYMREHHPDCRVLLISGQNETRTFVAEAAAHGHVFNVVAKPILPMNLLQELKKLSETQPGSVALVGASAVQFSPRQ